MKVLVAYENSGVIRRAFKREGHTVLSCDLVPSVDNSEDHIVGDAFQVIALYGPWDLVIAHPPCRYLCGSGWHHSVKNPERMRKSEQAFQHVKDLEKLLNTHSKSWCIENPVGKLSTWWKKPTQYLQPYEFGEDASKKTGLWLHNLPKITTDPTSRVEGRKVLHKGKVRERWANQTDSGQSRLGPSEERSSVRARTYPGIAQAMVKTWSK